MKDITEEMFEQYQAEEAFREEKRKAEEKAREQELLDHFAGLAMQGILSAQQDMRANGGSYGNHYSPKPLADECYDIAKAMLKARKEAKL